MTSSSTFCSKILHTASSPKSTSTGWNSGSGRGWRSEPPAGKFAGRSSGTPAGTASEIFGQGQRGSVVVGAVRTLDVEGSSPGWVGELTVVCELVHEFMHWFWHWFWHWFCCCCTTMIGAEVVQEPEEQDDCKWEWWWKRERVREREREGERERESESERES